MRASALVIASSLFAFACGGSTANQNDAGTNPNDDAGVAPDTSTTDDGAADAGPIPYPAPHTAMPQVDYNGGRVLQNPKIVTITWAQDDAQMVSRVQQFGDIITSTAWWTAVSSEYCQQPGNKPCIGPGTSGGHVVIQDAPDPNGYTDSSQGAASTIQDFIHDHVVGGNGITADFPTPDDNTLYVLYFPPGVSITLDGSGSCDSFGAYHNTVQLPYANQLINNVAYAIIPRCGTKESTTTVSASHEIIEAATDPDIGETSLSYYMLNQLWAVAGGEVGDLCEGIGSSGTTTTESTFIVQRSWSNKSAASGHNPCVPIPANDVYFNAAPRQQKVVLAKAGATAVLDIDAFSDAPMDPWTLTAIDFAQFQQQLPLLTFAFDKTQVQNGDHVQLTITAKAAMPSGGDEFMISSKDANGNRHSWPVLAAAH
jgi:hypothetical protein